MALFPNVNGTPSFKGKTHTGLVVSEGNAPAEDMIISRENAAQPFIYEYGPDANQTVVLAKGKIAELAGTEYDPESGFTKTAVKQAGDASEKTVGVVHHNVYAKRRDGMHSHLVAPTLITRNYIEVPVFETVGAGSLEASQALAEAMKFGAAVSDTTDAKTLIGLGDYIVSDRSGNYRKYVKGTDAPEAILGQVWAKEQDLPPAGFLQYYSEIINPEMEAYLKAISTTPSPGIPSNGGGAYPYGAPYTVKGWKPEFEQMMIKAGIGGVNSGIPFLTDGFFRAQEMRTFDGVKAGALDENIEAVRATDGVAYDLAANKVTVAAGVRNAAIFIKVKNKIDITKLADVSVNLGGVKVNAQDLHVDVTNNTIVIYLPMNESKAVVEHAGLSMTLPLVVDPIAGVPTRWDFKGSTGGLRILLQK